MTETLPPLDDLTALHARVDHLTARLDRIETRATAPSAMDDIRARLSNAWSALRGGPPAVFGPSLPAEPRKAGPLWPILALCVGLLGLILAVELADQVFDLLADLWRWID